MPHAGDSVLLGLSGGVDSSVCAWLLKRGGRDVVAVTLRFCDTPATREKTAHAAQTCEQLGIEHHVIDARERFAAAVERPFAAAAAAGDGANPCVGCTAQLKVPLLLEAAREHGCARVATGHYAAVTADEGRSLLSWQLRCPKDKSKDQSFLLYALEQEQLAQLEFPLANRTKPSVRQLAMRAGLQRLSPLHDGQGTPCFFGDGDGAAWLEGAGALEPAAGEVVSLAGGAKLGRHDGLHRYACGQRWGEGLYVVGKDVRENVLVVAPHVLAGAERVLLSDVFWTSIEPPQRKRSCRVRTAYDATPHPAQLVPTADGLLVNFTRPLVGLYPGQLLVFYSDDLVLGGGHIAC